MALGPLSLNIITGIIGRPFSATVSGQSAGSTVDVVGSDGTPGFSTVNGRVFHAGLPYAVNTIVLRETLPGEGFRDSRIDIVADGIALGAAGLPAAEAALGVNSERLTKLLRAFGEASDGYNAYDRPAMASPPTFVAAAATDNTVGLGAAVTLASAGGLTAAAMDRVAWYGGVPSMIASKYVALPVASNAPALTGNLSGFANAVVTADLNQWCAALEIVTESPVIEFGIYGRANRPVMCQVDGQYISKSGVVGAQAGNADNFFLLTFATRKERRIRIMLGADPATGGASYPFQIRVVPTASFRKPDQSSVLRMAWNSDSFGEGQGDGAYSIPNGPMPLVAGELLGFRDVRQVSVGTTGYVAVGGTNPTFRSRIPDQVPRWIAAQGPWDLIVFAGGYNDFGSPIADITANALLSFQRARAGAPNTPIIVLGSQAGARGPNQGTLDVEAAIKAAVLQFGDTLCRFMPVSSDTPSWQSGTGRNGATTGVGNSDFTTSSDAVHPSSLTNGGGHEYLGYRAASAIRTGIRSMVAS